MAKHGGKGMRAAVAYVAAHPGCSKHQAGGAISDRSVSGKRSVTLAMQAGWIAAEPKPGDRRGTMMLTVTPAGLRVIAPPRAPRGRLVIWVYGTSQRGHRELEDVVGRRTPWGRQGRRGPTTNVKEYHCLPARFRAQVRKIPGAFVLESRPRGQLYRRPDL